MKDKEDIKEKIFPATVVRVIDDYNVAINRGSEHGIKLDKRFAIYGITSEEIIDPETGGSLGALEIFKGNGKIVNVQPKLSTLRSTMKQKARKEVITDDGLQTGESALFMTLNYPQRKNKRVIEYPEEDLPFSYPEINDKAKPI
jgi:hypothetical protein